jgi:5-methyltetrahydropteroyltriglutamate--homocysteine methyltransferase
VLGLISSKRIELEPRAEIVARIEEASRYFPRERLGLSTQCGFGTVWDGNPIPESTQEAKLRLVAEIAHQVWR